MIKKFLLFGIVVVLNTYSFSAVVNEKLYILRDSLTMTDGVKIPYLTFNDVQVYSSTNARIEININDQLDLWIVNQDTTSHEFEIKGITSIYSIAAGDSIFTSNIFTSSGAYIFYDTKEFPKYAYLGLSGMIVVKNHNHASFYWNIKDHRSNWNTVLTSGSAVDWTNYYPNYFTINGLSSPNINLDSDAHVTGSVGDTLIIYVSNTGQSIHPLHFHGYHVDILSSSKFPSHIGRSKDTEGVFSFECSVLRLIPDKPGEYPVHDHNLVATTGGNIYPLGMFLTMLITP